MVLFFTLESIKKLRGLVTMETFSKSDISMFNKTQSGGIE